MERSAGVSPRTSARITGIIYLLYFLTAISGEAFVGRSRPILYDAVSLISDVFYIAVSLLFYFMFRPVNRTLSFLAALFSILGCAVAALGTFHLTLHKISPLIFFAPFCLLLGYLILKSTFL